MCTVDAAHFKESDGLGMEILEIVGRKHVDFTDDKGKHIVGWSIYYLMDDDHTEGKMAGKMFISEDRASSLQLPVPGTKCEVSYDRYGRATRFVVCK